MSDIFTSERRIEIMSRISGGNTKPEIVVRKLLHSMGYRFRLHDGKLPGRPDIVLSRHKKVIFVHGCFGMAIRDAAFRWHTANEIRRKKIAIRDKILEYMLKNVGTQISGEELRYVAGDKTEWARRVRELRTELGWQVMTKTTGMPNLPVGVYVLASDRQAPEHDRSIPDPVRREVLRRDDYKCQQCGWHQDKWNPSDPRHLEAHHRKEHVKGGENSAENLVTLCNICHDIVHRK